MTRACLFILAASVGALHAQQARDSRVGPDPAGTALVSGVVVSDENPDRQIARAIVTLTGGGLILGRTTITGPDGRFTFGNLPPGDVTIRATKGGYVPAVYGAKRPGRPGTPLTVADGQRSEIQIRLPRGAAIAGAVRNAMGQPAPGVAIEVVPVPRVPGPARNVSPHTTLTDDRGMYRVYGLLPGDYVVAAIPPRPGFSASVSLPGMEMRSMGSNDVTRRSSAEIDAIFRELQARAPGTPSTLTPPAGPAHPIDSSDPPVTYGYAPIYFPGTPVVSQASKITLRQAETREGIDIGVDLIRTTTVRGVVTNPQGALPTLGLSIQATDSRPGGAAIAAPVLSKSPGTDGQFEYTGLAPGRYVIWARSRDGAPPIQTSGGGVVTMGSGTALGSATPSQLWAMAEIIATGERIDGVTLTLQPTLQIEGQLRFDGATLDRPESLASTRLILVSETAPFGGAGNLTNFGGPPIPAAQVRTDGTFQFAGLVPGVYRLSATVPGASGWWPQSAMLGDRDLLDLPLEVGRAGEGRPVVITFSDRPAVISGSLRAAEGTPAPDYYVVVFPADRTLWRAGSRRIQTVRPATNGGFSIGSLPAGEYLIGALTDMDPADVHDPAFLEQVAAAAIKIQLADGEQKRQDIQISR